MESKATVRYLRSTPRKARLVADVVRGKMVGEALGVLEFGVRKTVATDVAKLIKSAVANMQSKNAEAAIEVDGLRIKEIRVDEGPVMKRYRPRARGRASQVIKRMCHITVTVSN
ncbi:50S ribosomal protein L22 [Chitinispirillales bacterium ANBcel5]|uniref:50S ribosomal protein L22 n=1 Tax=Cellulosispirillum alkaliphilum TaxID=3039283 RepID=UPI002A4EE489|nr:50S ribosomal protein L22 [Chitinispirillales bacterium ANBcel5]